VPALAFGNEFEQFDFAKRLFALPPLSFVIEGGRTRRDNVGQS
jgi:hypothetical protein